MIFSTINQLNLFILYIFFGVIVGVIFQLFFILFLKNYQKLWQKIIFDTIFCSIFCIFFVILSIFYNFGQFSYVLLIAYLVGYFWIKKLSKKIVVKVQKKWYTLLIRKFKNEKSKHKN